MKKTDEKFPADPAVDDKNLYLCFRLIKENKFTEAEQKIQDAVKVAAARQDKSAEALYLSALGVLYKVQKDYKKSYKFYQQAEKLLPDDPALKIIVATLLIEEFAQYDSAQRKLDKILSDKSQDLAITHHAQVLSALAQFLMGKKDQAKKILTEINASDFLRLRSTSNLNFKLVELFVAKSFAREECLTFLRKAKDLAVQARELPYQEAIQNLLSRI